MSRHPLLHSALLLLLLEAPAGSQEKPPKEAPAAGSPPVFRTIAEGALHNMKDELSSLGRVKPNPADITSDSCTAPEALRRAQAWARAKSAPNALETLAADPSAKTVSGLMGIAGAAAIKRNFSAAVAALLTALSREPENGPALANLAAALAAAGLCAEAVPLADTAEFRVKETIGPMGVPWRTIALNAKGYALLRQGKFAEAVAPLRQAVTSGGPLVSDAERNLALALKNSGEEEEAKKYLLMACWRRSVPQPVCYGGKTPQPGEAPPAPFEPSRTTRAPAALIYDLSQGKDGKFPTFGHPHTGGQFLAFMKYYQRELKDNADHLQAKMAWTMAFAQKGMGRRDKTASDRRDMHIINTINTIYVDPDLAPLWKAMDDGEKELKEQLKPIFNAASQKTLEIIKSGAKDARERLRQNTTATIAQSNGACNTYDTLVRKYWAVARRYMSGLAANIKDPDFHDEAVHDIQTEESGTWIVRLLGNVNLAYAAAYAAGGGVADEEALDAPQKPGVDEQATGSCPPGLDSASAELGAGPLSVTISCESLGVEFSGEGLISGFISVETKFNSGEVTVFGGAKLDANGKGPLPGFTFRDGVYVTADAKGIKDAGFRVNMETFKEAGGFRAKMGIDNMDFSIMPSAR